MRELCFKIELHDKHIQPKDDIFIYEFIDFAIKNKVSLSGNFHTGFCFCVDFDKELSIHMKDLFIHFIKIEYSKLISEVIFQTFNESTDEFNTLDIIQIAS